MSFQQGLSGLNVSAKALDIISNNVANTNTVGFKSGGAIFADVFAASLTGSISGKQVGVGGTLAAVRQSFTQGNLTTTNNPLDLAVNGDGFFIVSREQGPNVYTRNGQFELDKDGFILTPTGEKLMGFQSAVAAGALPTPVGGLKEIQIPVVGSQPVATSNVVVGGNLDANDESPSIKYPTLPAFPGLEANDAWKDARTYNYSTSIKSYDSLGKAHELTFYFVKDDPADPDAGGENSWKVYTSVDGKYPLGVSQDADGNNVYDDTKIWSFVFDDSGEIDTDSLTGPSLDEPLVIDAADYSPGAADIEFYVDFTAMRQIGGPYLITELTQDGYTGGELAGVSVGRDGMITGRYTNGETRELAQLALQTFRNPNALLSIGNNFWEATNESGLIAPAKPGEGVAGVVSAGMVEDANVELTTELVQMIVQQRNYQANAQSIKAQDQILQTLVNLR